MTRSTPQVGPPSVEAHPVEDLTATGVEVAAVPVTCDDDRICVGPGSEQLLDRLHIDVLELLDRQHANGKSGGQAGELLALPVVDGSSLRQALFVGIGEGAPADFRRAGAALARRSFGQRVVATSVSSLAGDRELGAYVEGLVLGSFAFSRHSSPPKDWPAEQFWLAEAAPRPDLLARARVTASAGWVSRDLALTPANEKSPRWLVDRADEAATAGGLDLKVWDEKALATDGFGGILAVGQGSPRPSRLIQLSYRPRRSTRLAPHVVLVGKGITFDSGGLSLKPAAAMMNMKRDMTGGGVVLAVMAALRELDVEVRVTGLVAAAENSISGSALRPDDVVTHYGGRTSEVGNTDAEGRLVLADALAYAVHRLQPDVLVDVATLTGAVKVALGLRTGGMYADDDILADALLRAGERAGEPLWRLPLVEDYEELLHSPIADATNAPDGPAGSINAALFLRPFTSGVPWAHLDIASVGDSPVDAYEWTLGATGFGARALLHWLTGPRPRFPGEKP